MRPTPVLREFLANDNLMPRSYRALWQEMLEHIEELEKQSHEPQPIVSVSEFLALREMVGRVVAQVGDVVLMLPSAFRAMPPPTSLPLSTRDYFAGCAIQNGGLIDGDHATTARTAYALADAMLLAREWNPTTAGTSEPSEMQELQELQELARNDGTRCFQCNQRLFFWLHDDGSVLRGTFHEFVEAPAIPCECGALFNEPVHEPKYGSHVYKMGEHKFEPQGFVSLLNCRWCGTKATGPFHTVTKPVDKSSG